MRRLGLLFALVLTGCGGGAAAPPPAPTPDPALLRRSDAPRPVPLPPRRPLGAAVRDALAGGAIAVTDLTGRAAVRPARLEIASDAVLERLRWSAWKPGRAVATGTLRSLVCNPSCATGRVDEHPARVELSSPVECPAGSFYGRASVSVDGAPAPAAFIRAPC